MKFSGGIIRFSQTRKYRILWITLASLAGLFLFIAMIVGLTTGGVAPMNLVVSAPNIVRGAGGVHQLEVYARQTPITVNTAPGNQTRQPVRLSIHEGHAFVSLPDSQIRSGESAMLILRNNPETGIPFITTDERITIHVRAGNHLSIINVRIGLSRENVQMTTRIQRFAYGSWHNSPPGLESTIDANRHMIDQRNYRVFSTFSVFGQEIYNSATHPHMFNVHDRDPTGETNIDLFRPRAPAVGPWNPAMGTYLYTPIWFLMWSGTFDFAIEVEFMGHRFVESFALNIVV